jgi:hypothetical protein
MAIQTLGKALKIRVGRVNRNPEKAEKINQATPFCNVSKQN